MLGKITMWKPIIFIINPIDVRCDLPSKIGSHFLLRRATQEEIPVIKHYLAPSFAGAIMNQNPYEQKYLFKNENKSVGKLTNLPQNDWRYFVIELQNMSGQNLLQKSPIDLLRVAADLTNAELKFDIELLDPRIVNIRHNSLHKITNGLKFLIFDHYVYSEKDLEDLRTVYTAVSKYFMSNEFLSRSLTFFNLLQDVPSYLNFVNLNYFSILEMLVTIKSNTEKPSITEQLKYKTQKILELEGFSLSFGDSFEVTSNNNVWNKLYEYRSCLAHGSHADFGHGLKKLKSEENVHSFLKDLLKKLFRCYLFNFENALKLKNDLNFA